MSTPAITIVPRSVRFNTFGGCGGCGGHGRSSHEAAAPATADPAHGSTATTGGSDGDPTRRGRPTVWKA